jgi:hypothetical protein
MGTVSYSEIEDFNRCRNLWHYRNREFLVPVADFNQDLLMGSAVHHYLHREILSRIYEDYYSLKGWMQRDYTGEEFKELDPMVQDVLLLINKQAVEIAKRTAKLLGIHDKKWQPLYLHGKPAAELKLISPTHVGDDFKGIVDWIACDQEGRTWLTEFKTRKKFSDEDGARFVQLPLYYNALLELGIKVDGVMTVQILPVTDEDPQLLKSGKMSRSAIKCSWEHYADALVNAGLSISEYEDEMRTKLAATEWIRVSKGDISERVARSVWEECLLKPVQTMRDPGMLVYPNRSAFNCGRCDYRRLCEAELFHEGVDFARQFYAVDEGRKARKLKLNQSVDTKQSTDTKEE